MFYLAQTFYNLSQKQVDIHFSPWWTTCWRPGTMSPAPPSRCSPGGRRTPPCPRPRQTLGSPSLTCPEQQTCSKDLNHDEFTLTMENMSGHLRCWHPGGGASHSPVCRHVTEAAPTILRPSGHVKRTREPTRVSLVEPSRPGDSASSGHLESSLHYTSESYCDLIIEETVLLTENRISTDYILVLKMCRILNTEYIRVLKNDYIQILNTTIWSQLFW